MQNDSKNTLIFFVCMAVLLVVYQLFVLQPAEKRREAEARAHAAAASSAPAVASGPAAIVTVSREQALAQSPRRIRIDGSPGCVETSRLKCSGLVGSIALKGGRIDDLFLKGYHQAVGRTSPLVEMFRPEGTANAYFADFGWTGANLPGLPGGDTVWSAPADAVLSPGRPVTLSYTSPQGLEFTRTIAVDDNFMFTVKDTVANKGPAAVTVAPYATVQRQGLPPDSQRAWNVHQGALGWLGQDKQDLQLSSYTDWAKKGEIDYPSKGGWLGITDKYWMAALVPAQDESVKAAFRVTPVSGVKIYDASFLGRTRTVAPGMQVSTTTRLFAGAKTVPLLSSYRDQLGIPEFTRAVDWGRLFFLTQPIFAVLEFFYGYTHNFGIAILLLTVCVKLLFFWPANKSYESMTKMKKVQPELEKLRARHKDDPAKQQQEMAALYQREKINPLLGCLPMLATIPVFLALFKVLNVSIEMRHAPFFGWVQDLSARDPSTMWNLFGLIPWNPSLTPLIGGLLDQQLHVGVWALLYGFTMWLTQSMSPSTGMDPTQQKILQFMPLIFTFTLSQFAVGLLIYYTWSNLLTIVQQYVIMRRFKVDNPIDQIVRRLTGPRPQPSG
jgi:YidC/Oxa1 family membrane protein insertase